MQTAKERMENAKALWEAAGSDNEELRRLLAFLKESSGSLAPLSAYYFEEWMPDLQALEQAGFHNEVMNEDAIYEEISERYSLMKEILLVCAKYISGESLA